MCEYKHLIIENIEVFNIVGALRGMRNPMESWNKSDSYQGRDEEVTIGNNDKELAIKLCLAGSEHRKYMRQIFISCDVIAPWYWWKEYATYKVGTTENSTSQMHKLGSRLLTKDDFVIDNWDESFNELLCLINLKIEIYQKDKTNKENWRSLIQMIPGSFIYRRTITLNYEILKNQYNQRKSHKLIEWREYLDQMIHSIPISELIVCG